MWKRVLLMDWIKMRRDLVDHPKVVAMCARLREDTRFSAWLTFDPRDDSVTQMSRDARDGCVTRAMRISHDALRRLVCGAVMCAWSVARVHGNFVGDDLVLPHNVVDDLDQLSGVPGLGRAMESVGWVIDTPAESPVSTGVTLPHFKTYNVPKTAAERQAAHRKRLSPRSMVSHETVTQMSRTRRDKSVTREEKSREENKQANNVTNVTKRDEMRAVLFACLQEHGISNPGYLLQEWHESGWMVTPDLVAEGLRNEPSSAGGGARVETLRAFLSPIMRKRASAARRAKEAFSRPCAWCGKTDVPKHATYDAKQNEQVQVCARCHDEHLRRAQRLRDAGPAGRRTTESAGMATT